MPRSQPKPQRSGIGPERALEANTPTPRAQRESSSSPEPTQRAEARCRGAPPSKTEAERCRAGASLGGEHPNPLAQSAKNDPSLSLLSERRPDAAEPGDKAPLLEFPPERP